MRKPNIIFLSVITLAALLPHTSRWLNNLDKPTTASNAPAVTTPEPVSAQASKNAAPLTPAISIAPGRLPESAVTEAQEISALPEAPHPWHVLPIPAPDENPLADLENIYLTEGFDPAWAAPLEERFHQVVDAANLQDSAVERAECRATLCRVAVNHKDPAAQEAFVQAFLHSRLLSGNHGTITHHSQTAADGGIAAVYLLARNETGSTPN